MKWIKRKARQTGIKQKRYNVHAYVGIDYCFDDLVYVTVRAARFIGAYQFSAVGANNRPSLVICHDLT